LCPLAETRTQVVFGVGSPSAQLMFVGEGPGQQEDLQGEPFVGRAGKLLTQLIEGIGLTRADVYIANVVKCRPPGNRDPLPVEIEACSPWLDRQLELIVPAVIVTLGNFATKLLLDTKLGITRLLCPRTSGVLCALGLAAAAPRRDVARTVMLRGDGLSSERLTELRRELLGRASKALGESPARVRVRHELRYKGQSFELSVEESSTDGEEGRGLSAQALRSSFAEAHEARYGYRDDHAEVELVTLRLSVWGSAPPLAAPMQRHIQPRIETREIVFAGETLAASVIRGEPTAGVRFTGPALLALADSTLLVPPGWSGEADAHGTLHLAQERRP